MHVKTTDGAELSYEEWGAGGLASGEPLLLLHGFTGTGNDWQHVFDRTELARTYRVIAPDARGHGRSRSSGGACADIRARLIGRCDAQSIAQSPGACEGRSIARALCQAHGSRPCPARSLRSQAAPG